MPGCAAIGCNNRSEKGYAMKCFPRNPALRTLWTERVCRADWVPSKNSFLCNVHFDANQWTILQNGRTKLKRNAVPSIFTITSTRKSPRKRCRVLKIDDKQDANFVEYIDDSLESFGLIPSLANFHNQSHSKLDRDKRSDKAMHGHNDKSHNTVIVIDDDDDDDANQFDSKDGILWDKPIVVPDDTSTKNRVKLEMKYVESDQDTDDIERKLRWICEGEVQPEQKIKTEPMEFVEKNGKSVNFDKTVDDEIACSKQNGETKKKKIVGKTSKTNVRRYESVKDVEKSMDVEESVNGIVATEEKCDKPFEKFSGPMDTMFTIKVTGMDEDVTEIVRTLGTEPIYKYKSDASSTSDCNKNFVTSIISVSDRSIAKSDGALLEPKVEMKVPWPRATRTGWTAKEMDYLGKLSAGTRLDDDSNSTNCQQLRERVKFQDEIICKLNKRLTADRGSMGATSNAISSKKDSELKNMSERIIRLDELNKNLSKRLMEKNQQTRKLEWLIRQRNNRIKQLNWKLEKASKYVAWVEKNSNGYKKKMINMRAAFARRKNIDERRSRDSSVGIAGKLEKVSDNAREGRGNEERGEMDENIVYRTVQDIFDESNNCDDDPSVIDTREEFLREFEGAL